jgi:hypothetical protein
MLTIALLLFSAALYAQKTPIIRLFSKRETEINRQRIKKPLPTILFAKFFH